jgi:DNA-binding transcriptional regulator YiaG
MPRTTKNKKRPATKRLGERITQGLTEALEALRSGEPLERRFRVDTIEIPDPPRFTPAAVRMLRAQLRVTQSMLAKILGVSVELVEHWEQGIRTPRPMACRLLNELRADPDGFIKRLPAKDRAA